MKFVLIPFTALVAVPAFAADYSACAPIAYGRAKPEYQIDAKGSLVMDRKNPDVIKANGSANLDTYVVRVSKKPAQNQVQELRRENGQPVSIKTYTTDGKGKPTGGATTRRFAMNAGRCFVKEVEFSGQDGDDQKGKFVTYDQAFCANLLKVSEGMTEAPKDVQRVAKVVNDFDQNLRKGGRSLFGYDVVRLRFEAPEVIASIVGTCNSVGASFPALAAGAKKAGRPASQSAGSDEAEEGAGAQ